MKTKTRSQSAYIKEERGRSFFGNAFSAFIYAALTGAVFLFLSALLLFFKPPLLPYANLIGCACGAVTALICGMISGARTRHAGALAGLLSGLLYLALLILIGNIFHTDIPLSKTMVGYAIFLLLSVLGGMLGALRLTRKHRPRHR